MFESKMFRKLMVVVLSILFISSVSMAAIVEYSETFCSASSVDDWYAFTGSPVISHEDNTVAQYDWTDNDDTAAQSALNYGDPIPAGGSVTGDGVVADGAMVFDTQNGDRGDERIAYNLGGTIDEGEEITFEYHVFNNVDYWHTVTGYLYDLTDDVQLTPDDWISCWAASAENYNPASNVATYTGTADTAGHEIAIVFREWCSSGARTPVVDNVSVTSIPEPATMTLLGLGGLVLFRRRKA